VYSVGVHADRSRGLFLHTTCSLLIVGGVSSKQLPGASAEGSAVSPKPTWIARLRRFCATVTGVHPAGHQRSTRVVLPRTCRRAVRLMNPFHALQTMLAAHCGLLAACCIDSLRVAT
jgi:hypothetical protein